MRITSGFLLCAILATLAACGGGSSGSSSASPTDPTSSLDARISRLAADHALTGNPVGDSGLLQRTPQDDPMVKLGQQLFFSQSLSGSFDVACGTCHLPQLGGSDGLSLSIGVVPVDRRVVGPARSLDVSRDQDPSFDGGPNMHRNSLTTFNAALFNRNLMSDGRIRVADEAFSWGGHGQTILTPEADITGDLSGVDGLLEALAKFPVSNDNEMRGFLYTDLSAPDDFRQHLVERFKGNVDSAYMSANASANWLQLFRNGFSAPAASADELITLVNIQRALAKYVESQIFIDTPWASYLKGEGDALSEAAKRGAILFYSDIADGGLGCAACHSGDRFTNEGFYNVGFPQLGRGFLRGDKRDLGRWQVTRNASGMFAHRVPSLLNVDLTAPYGHAGAFESLSALLNYHVNPVEAVNTFDFGLTQLPQFRVLGISYPEAEALTRETITNESFLLSQALLPNRRLSASEEDALTAFLRALTDRCAANSACSGAWMPSPSEDPDGNMLGADNGPAPNVGADPDVSNPYAYPASVPLAWPTAVSRDGFADTQNCTNGLSVAANSNQQKFIRKEVALGLTAKHGFEAANWSFDNVIAIQYAMIAGGLTAAYLDDDCWADIVFAGGDASGMVAYVNQGQQAGFVADNTILAGSIPAQQYRRYTGVAVADLDGDYSRELVYGNLGEGDVVISARNATGQYAEAARLPMSRNTYGISFGDSDADGFLDMFLSHWSAHGVEGTAPAFWRNNGGVSLLVNDSRASTISVVQHRRTFTPSFSDLRNAGVQDLVVASDFGTSMVLQNDGDGVYLSKTDPAVITDENGMGGTVGDFNNDGKVDWFVTSVLDPLGYTEANWGITGNRLYTNVSSEQDIVFSDTTATAGVRDGGWGWGVCKADFNNDGYLDIFHVNGFGYIPPDLGTDSWLISLISSYMLSLINFMDVTPRLFINNGDGTFSEQAAGWGIDVASEGRGVVCLDYDRDGDIDIGLLNHSRGIQFFENQQGHGAGHHFLNVRLIGRKPNTDAVGARVQVVTDVGNGLGVQRQIRDGEANSNFNSQNLPDLHFGVGESESLTMSVRWTDGSGVVCEGVDANQFIVIDQRDYLKADAPFPGCQWYIDLSMAPAL